MTRFMKFSVRTLCVLVALICIWLAFMTYRHDANRKRRREISSRIVDQALMRLHFEAWDHQRDPQAGKLLTQLLDSLTPSDNRTEFIMPRDADNDDVNEFERALLTEFAGATDREFAERTEVLGDSYVFYGPVRSNKNCVLCHLGNPGDFMGMVKVELVERP